MVSMTILLSTVGCLTSWFLYWSNKKELKQLERSIPLDDAAIKLALEGRKPLVHVEGRLNADVPILCTHANAKAVVYTLETNLITSVWSERLAKWSETSQNIGNVYRAATSWLYPTIFGQPRIRMTEDALLEAKLEIPLKTVYHNMVEFKKSSVDALIQYAKGEVPLGTRITEKVLEDGTNVTVVGTLQGLDKSSSDLAFPPPSQVGAAATIIISKRSHSELLSSSRRSTTIYLWISAIATVALASYLIIKWWKKRRSSGTPSSSSSSFSHTTNRIVNPPPSRPSTAVETSSSSPNVEVSEENLCIICCDRKRDAVFLPCGHFQTCLACTEMVADCPLCRNPITHVVKVFS